MAGLTAQQLADFDRDGYLVVEDVLDESGLEAIRAEYAEIMERESANLVAAGHLEPMTGKTFSERYTEALGQLDDMYLLYQHLDISLPMLDTLEPSATMNAGPAVFALLTNPQLLDIAESVIGSEIYSNPVQHARIKPPRKCLPQAATDANVAATLWHQDAAVIEPSGDDTDMLTVWLAITDATVENGCLIAVPGSHRGDSTLHCPGKVFQAEIYIPEAVLDMERVVPLEVKAGGTVLLHKMTEHGSLENNTEDIRWSFDLRYQPIGQPTGRDVFPGFIARSAADPAAALTDAAEWAELWWKARDRIVTGQVDMSFGGRWNHNADQLVCA
ncbi:MAG: phytanoyl-CoA dioxygenase family protein [Acidimicrobiia bacterium]|nr:phytanoyl-CoA dioxygenase family protein [Acidimicrobiia bacterium]